MVVKSWLAGPFRTQSIPGVTAAGGGTGLATQDRDLTGVDDHGQSVRGAN